MEFEFKAPVKTNLPDVAAQKENLGHDFILQQVGMSQIEVPLLLADQSGQVYRTAGVAEAFVNLVDVSARGIHMSRLFKIAQDHFAAEELSAVLLQKILTQFLDSHQGLSDTAMIAVSFSALLQRPALKSENLGFRSYPVKFIAEQKREESAQFFIETTVTYSSTCPASAALARQLIQQQFQNDFNSDVISKVDVLKWLGSPAGMVATPHAQRSYAKLKVQLREHSDLDYIDLIDAVEDCLQTPVQSVVKREDEQEFAKRNGQNLMFCEDAARRIQQLFEQMPDLTDYQAEVRHVESLHPHDAVARISKN